MDIQNLINFTRGKNEANLCVLIIEDNTINTQAIKTSLQNLGISNILIAKTGEEAIEHFSEKIDIIFMDVNLPDTSGFKLTHHYRKNFPKKDTPIICWSATVTESQRKKCIEAGMDDFLPKPATLEDVKDILECWIPYRIDRTK